jgi:hypothetical protein
MGLVPLELFGQCALSVVVVVDELDDVELDALEGVFLRGESWICSESFLDPCGPS